jgi:hypothetical protein
MHGLINRSLECFLGDTYGADVWTDIAHGAGMEFVNFESMLEYEDALTFRVLAAAASRLSKSTDTILEDLGTYLVSDPKVESIRRLMRFGGVSFQEFLHSLDDLHDRVKLAVPDLDLPRLTLTGSHETGEYRLVCNWKHRGAGRVLTGILRTMADDYGALVLLDDIEDCDGCEVLPIQVIETSFADGRDFSLAIPAGDA